MKKREQVRILFNDDIWAIDSKDVSRPYGQLVHFVKLARLTLETFARNRMGFQCVSLSYFITLALVPFCALLFTVTGGLGLNDRINSFIESNTMISPEVARLIIEKSGNIIDIAKSGGVGVISALLFLWAILWMMFQVERVFNNVWGIRKVPRKLYTRFGFYLLVLFLLPFIIITFGFGIAMQAHLTRLLGIDIENLRVFQKIIGYLAFYLVTVFTFSVMYKYIPTAYCKYSNALKAAAFAAIFFVGFQYLYLETQVFVARLNMVYGVLAAIPLFLIWLNFSWQIIIYGAELSFSLQNIDKYEKCLKD